jgi:small subunit ribosomal protein S13
MRILGITIPENKQLWVGLTEVYGIGYARAKRILAVTKVDMYSKPSQLNTEQENALRQEAEKFVLEGNLKREKTQNIKRLKDIQSYRGSRHARSLPVRGQRTKTNSRTGRGNKRATMASGRVKASKT